MSSAFRFNERDLNGLQRFVFVMSQVIGLRPTYKQLTGKDMPEESPDETIE
jgi:hypothetical protein